jgi:hypothetical protein
MGSIIEPFLPKVKRATPARRLDPQMPVVYQCPLGRLAKPSEVCTFSSVCMPTAPARRVCFCRAYFLELIARGIDRDDCPRGYFEEIRSELGSSLRKTGQGSLGQFVLLGRFGPEVDQEENRQEEGSQAIHQKVGHQKGHTQEDPLEESRREALSQEGRQKESHTEEGRKAEGHIEEVREEAGFAEEKDLGQQAQHQEVGREEESLAEKAGHEVNSGPEVDFGPVAIFGPAAVGFSPTTRRD